MAKILRTSSLLMAFNISLVLFPSSVFGSVSFPNNPQTMAECDGPAAEMRAMEEHEHALGEQVGRERNELRADRGCFGDEHCSAAYYEKHHQLYLEAIKHFGERDRIHSELRKLEKTCRAAAQANEQRAADARQKSFVALTEAYKEARKLYEEAKDKYNKAKELGSFLAQSDKEKTVTALKFAKEKLDGAVKETLNNAYVRRNDAYSDSLNFWMDEAKGGILGEPKSPVIGTVQGASFDEFKLQIQQLNGDMAALELAFQSESVRAEAPPTSGDMDTAPLRRKGGNSASAMFQEAINQAEEDKRDPSARKARERLALEQQAAAKAQEDQSSRDTWKVLGMLGNAVLAAAEGQTSTERMQLALNSLAQSGEESDTAGLSDDEDAYTSSSEATQGRTGLAMDECLRQENASDIGNKLTALPDSNLNLKMRGTIAACDFMIQTYSQCLPDQRAQQVVNQYKATREQTLRTCRQVSSTDNCLDSPFGGTVKTNVVRPSGRGGRNNGASTGNGNRSAQESVGYDACLKVGDPGCGRH